MENGAYNFKNLVCVPSAVIYFSCFSMSGWLHEPSCPTSSIFIFESCMRGTPKLFLVSLALRLSVLLQVLNYRENLLLESSEDVTAYLYDLKINYNN